jgi:hypothetical protein
MGQGVNERVRMSQFLGAPQSFARNSFGLVRRTKMPKGPAKVAKCGRTDVLTILMAHGQMALRIVERAGPLEMPAEKQQSRPYSKKSSNYRQPVYSFGPTRSGAHDSAAIFDRQ